MAVAAAWLGAAAALAALIHRPAARDAVVAATRRARVPLAFLAAVVAFGLLAYPAFDGRRDIGGGSDADDGVFLVLDAIRDGGDPYALDTYLGGAPTTGPGSALWFLPFGTRALYPLGIAAAVAVTIAAVRWAHGRWDEAGLVAVLLAGSVPFWEGVGQGSDHLVFACSLVWACCALRPRAGATTLDPRVVAAAAVVVGVLATSRALFGVVPVLAAASLWWRDRRAALLFGGIGSAVAVALHAWLIGRSGWDGYDPVQQLLVKGGDETPASGKALLALGALAAAALVGRELTRRHAARTEVLLLAGVVVPMSAIALAGLTAEPVEVWSGGNYLLDSVVLAAYWVTIRLLPAPRPAPSPPPR